MKKKLNIQALAIKEPRVVSNIIADDGRVFVGEDLISAEPMIAAMLSGDKYYRYAVYDGIGKEPYYERGILMINDIYLMYASVCPATRDKVVKNFDLKNWLYDPETEKKKLKAQRNLCKVVVLSASYGVGKKKLAQIFREQGYTLNPQEVSDAWESYWHLFAELRETVFRMQAMYQNQGYLINLFGYRLTPQNEKDSFNSVCQSSVSGLMNYFMKLKFERARKLDQRFITCIHDCLITEIPANDIEVSRAVTASVLKELNRELDWEIPVRTDFTVSKDFYKLKG